MLSIESSEASSSSDADYSLIGLSFLSTSGLEGWGVRVSVLDVDLEPGWWV